MLHYYYYFLKKQSQDYIVFHLQKNHCSYPSNIWQNSSPQKGQTCMNISFKSKFSLKHIHLSTPNFESCLAQNPTEPHDCNFYTLEGLLCLQIPPSSAKSGGAGVIAIFKI